MAGDASPTPNPSFCPSLGDVRAYQGAGTGPLALLVGIMPGEQRPRLWFSRADQPNAYVIASFHGEPEAKAFVMFLDTVFDDISAARAYWRERAITKTGEDDADSQASA